MKIQLIAIGTRMPTWVDQAYAEYAQRMPHQCKLELIELPAKKRGKNADTARILRDEAQAMEQAISPNAVVIALDRCGKTIDTEKLAMQMQQWIDNSQDVALLIGGPEGIDPDYLKKLSQKWSLSAMTFAHPVVRVMLAEQLYRAWSILANLPYHRGT